jgi:peptidoglycan hydrolase-like protein with peptidoglycan-binding domain
MIPWLVAAISLGFATAFIAGTKGRPFLPWLTYGTLLGIVAIPHALCLRKEIMPEDDEAEMRNRRDDSPKFTGSWAENWMESDSADAPQRRTSMTPGAPRRPDDVPAAWSDDAFARIVGDEPPLAEFGALGGRGSPEERPAAGRDEPPLAEFGAFRDAGSPGDRVPRDAPPAGYRPSPEDEQAPGVVQPVRRGEPAGAASFRRDDAREPPRRPSAGRMNGNGMADRDFLRVARDENDGGRSAASGRFGEDEDHAAFARTGYDPGVPDPHETGRDEPRFEPRLEFQGSGWHTGRRYDDARMAHRFAPDLTETGDADRREPRRGGRVLSYAVAALCMVLAVVLVWPRPSDGPPPDRIASTPVSPALKGLDYGSASEGGTIRPGFAPFAPQSPRGDDTFARSDTTVERSFAPPPAPPDADTARAKREGSDDGAPRPADKTARGIGASANVPPRPPEDPMFDGPEIKAAPSTEVARVDPAAPESARPRTGGTTRSAKAAPDKAAPKRTVPRKAAPEAPPTTKAPSANRAPSAPTKTESITAVGQMVVLVQAELKKRGYDPGELNGRAGEQTRQAIRAFKHKEGLAVNDAIDDELFERLGIVGRRIHPFASSSR